MFTTETFDTSSFTRYTDSDSQLCFKCGFLNGSTGEGCIVSVTQTDGNYKNSYIVTKSYESDLIAILYPVKSPPPTGLYNICVIDIDQFTKKCAISNSYVHLNGSGMFLYMIFNNRLHMDGYTHNYTIFQ